MATWPASLPQTVKATSFQETAPKEVIRTQMDAGPAKVRRRFTAGVRLIKGNVALRVDPPNGLDDVSILDSFFLNDCAAGALSFSWNSQRLISPSTDMGPAADGSSSSDSGPGGGASTDAGPTGSIKFGYTCRFVNPPVYKCLGGQAWEAQLDLEVLPQ